MSRTYAASELISVCICTFRRPDGLLAALESVARQQMLSSIKFEVIVVDNDALPSACNVCDSFQIKYPAIELNYFNETQSGVSFARNRCLSEASGEWLAFLDDDEQASDKWLVNLHNVAQAYKADAVFGPVIPTYEVEAPVWIISNHIHDRSRFATGTKIGWKDARTGNVLMSRKLAQAVGGFDLRMATTGGEDSFFFASAVKTGACLVWCNEAEISETVPKQRMTLKWAMQRALNGGRTFARINAAIYGKQVYVWWALHGLAMVIVLAAPTLGLWMLQSPRWIAYLRKIAGGVGKMVAAFYSTGVYSQK